MTQALPLRCVRTDAGIELESILPLRYVMSFAGAITVLHLAIAVQFCFKYVNRSRFITK